MNLLTLLHILVLHATLEESQAIVTEFRRPLQKDYQEETKELQYNFSGHSYRFELEFGNKLGAFWRIISIDGFVIPKHGFGTCSVGIEVSAHKIQLGDLYTSGCKKTIHGGEIINMLKSIADASNSVIILLDGSNLSPLLLWNEGQTFYEKYGFKPIDEKSENTCKAISMRNKLVGKEEVRKLYYSCFDRCKGKREKLTDIESAIGILENENNEKRAWEWVNLEHKIEDGRAPPELVNRMKLCKQEFSFELPLLVGCSFGERIYIYNPIAPSRRYL